MTKITTKLIIFITPLLFIIVIVSILFYPLINLKSSVKTQSGYNTTDYVVNNWNPIKPRITTIIKLSGENGFLIEVSDFSRTGIFEFTSLNELDVKAKPLDFGRYNDKIMNKNIDEVVKIVQTQDIEKNGYISEKSNAEIEYNAEKRKEIKCQKIVDYPEQKPNNLSDFNFVYLNMKYSILKNTIKNKGIGIIGKQYIEEYKIDNSGLIKIRLFFSDGGKFIDGDNLESKLMKVTKVYDDCREEEIPLPDGPLN